MKNNKQTYISIWIIILAYILINLFENEYIWGWNYLKFYNHTISYVISFVLVLILAGVTFFRKTISSKFATSHDHQDSRRQITILIFTSIVLTVAFYMFPSRVLLLGDSSLRIFEIAQGTMVLKTEFMDFLLHSALYHYVFEPLGKPPEFVYYIISPLCGIIFLIGVYRLANYLSKDNVTITFFLLLSSGLIVLFFGYVESYAIVASLLPYLYLYGLKAADNKGSVTAYLLLVIAAGLVHSVAFIIFLPSVMILLIIKRYHRISFKSLLYLYLGIGILSIALIYIFDISDLKRNLVPLIETEELDHSIFSINHYLNVLNWLLLVSLPVFFITPRICTHETFKQFLSNKKLFYSLLVLIQVLSFTFFFMPQLGGPRDWDLFAVVLYLLIPIVLTMYYTCNRKIGPAAIPLILLSFLNSFAFAGINNDINRSINRFEEVIEVTKFKNLTIDYLTLVNFVDRHELTYKRFGYLQKALEQPPLKKIDSTGVLSQLGLEYLQRNDKSQAKKFIDKAIETDSSHVKSYFILLEYLKKYESKDSLLSAVDIMTTRFPDNSEMLLQTGIACFQSEHLDKAGSLLDKASETDPNNIDILINYGLYLFNSKEYYRCIEIMKKAELLDSSLFVVSYHIAAASNKLRMIDESRVYLQKTKTLIKTRRESTLYQQLEREI